MPKHEEWRPTSTAPKDGTPVLVLFNEGEIVVCASNGDGWWDVLHDGASSWNDHYATGWLPLDALPPAPSRQKEEV